MSSEDATSFLSTEALCSIKMFANFHTVKGIALNVEGEYRVFEGKADTIQS